MTSFFQLLSSNPIILQVQQQKDPLIDYGAEHIIYFGVFLVIIAIAVILGIISRKMEHAILFSFVLSITFIVFLWNL